MTIKLLHSNQPKSASGEYKNRSVFWEQSPNSRRPYCISQAQTTPWQHGIFSGRHLARGGASAQSASDCQEMRARGRYEQLWRCNDASFVFKKTSVQQNRLAGFGLALLVCSNNSFLAPSRLFGCYRARGGRCFSRLFSWLCLLNNTYHDMCGNSIPYINEGVTWGKVSCLMRFSILQLKDNSHLYLS